MSPSIHQPLTGPIPLPPDHSPVSLTPLSPSRLATVSPPSSPSHSSTATSTLTTRRVVWLRTLCLLASEEAEETNPSSFAGGGLDGVLREYFLCDESGVVSIPEHLNYVQGCASVITVRFRLFFILCFLSFFRSFAMAPASSLFRSHPYP